MFLWKFAKVATTENNLSDAFFLIQNIKMLEAFPRSPPSKNIPTCIKKFPSRSFIDTLFICWSLQVVSIVPSFLVTSAYAAVKGYENHRHRKLNCSWTSLCYGSPTRQMPTQNANVADLKETRVSVQIPTDAPRPPTVTTAITPQSANDVHIPVPRNTDDDRRPRNSYFETSSHVKALLSLNNDFIPQPRPRIFTAW